jgi:hypothetical protein
LLGPDAGLLYLTGKGRSLDGMVFYSGVDTFSIHDMGGVGSLRIVTEFKDLGLGSPSSSTVFCFHLKIPELCSYCKVDESIKDGRFTRSHQQTNQKDT